MQNGAETLSPYTPPAIEVQTFHVEEGFADSITESWENSFSVEESGTTGQVDLFLWTDQTKTTPTNENEAFDLQWGNNDFWGN
ncbi:MAG: hypothetical protein AUK63_264 [bacterium P3]|nr:MAG: hypothetical protein AUK63_264 [bacterium P3]KWW42774.1 MAG: hypothetical protein F083_178 [bacterium F083]